ncbi:olfactory receptor 2T2-like [Ornithorhynchus anatinus]|uniref:Olfactory receptor n=1 Tax=Ornithorhynchus anatinus TaxID=9258 RepID=F7EG65_ORNAN|nr:olfactory receptor 2T2-like [Ornithorhynchus anatinus]
MEEFANQSSTTDFILPGLFTHSGASHFLFSLVCAIFTVALTANAVLILLIGVDPRLRTPMYFLLSQLSVLDVSFISVTVPKMAVDFLSGRNVISFPGCGTQMFFFLLVGAAECLLLGFMAYDRYLAVCHPLRYPVLMSRQVCLLMVAGSWMGGILDGAILTPLTLGFPFCRSREIPHFFCEIPAVLQLSCSDVSRYETRVFLSGIVFLLLPISFIVASYAFILASVLRMKSTEGRQKAFATCSSHLTVVGLFYGIIIFMYMTPRSYHTPKQDKTMSVFYTILTPMMNPLIYSLRNKEVMGALGRMMRRCTFA